MKCLICSNELAETDNTFVCNQYYLKEIGHCFYNSKHNTKPYVLYLVSNHIIMLSNSKHLISISDNEIFNLHFTKGSYRTKINLPIERFDVPFEFVKENVNKTNFKDMLYKIKIFQ